ncbi:MAG: RNA polymerase sigma factor [Victivallaceae bacterium]
MPESEDREIIEQVLNGKIEDFSLLIDKYKRRVFGLVSRRIPAVDLEDTVQDVFIRIYSSLGSFSKNKPFENWLTIITLRGCCDYWRKKSRQKEYLNTPVDKDQLEWLDDLSSKNETGRDVPQAEMAEMLKWTLNQLSAEDRTLVEMIYFEELPIKDAAETLEWGLSKTKIRAMRARHKMRKIISTLC